MWNLPDQTAEGLLASGEEWLQNLAVIRAQGEEAATFEAVYAEAVRRVQPLHGPDHVGWYDLMRIVLTWATWHRPAPERATLLTAAQASPADAAHQLAAVNPAPALRYPADHIFQALQSIKCFTVLRT